MYWRDNTWFQALDEKLNGLIVGIRGYSIAMAKRLSEGCVFKE